MAGHMCIRIRSTYKVKKEKLKLRLQPKAQQQELGGAFGEQPMDIAPMEDMMAMDAGAMGPEGMGAEGMGTGAPELETDYTGERITFWAFDVNRPVRIVDTITHSLEIERQSQMTDMSMMGGEFTPGMEAMPVGPEAMGPPPGEPGMAPPNAPPGAPGGVPAGEPGMMAPGEMGPMGEFGAQQMQPAEPLKVRINVSLIIEEVPHAQGLR